MTDKQLIKLLRADSSAGMSEVINTYSALLTSVAMRILKNPQDAEECAADTFISLWKNFTRLKKSDSLKAYLLGIVHNNAIDRYRKQKNQSSISVEEIEGFEIIAGDNVELSVIKKEFTGELQKMIMKFSEPHREIFVRKYLLFESIKEIAENLNLNEAGVRDRLHRSRNQIKKNFEKRGIDYAEIICTLY